MKRRAVLVSAVALFVLACAGPSPAEDAAKPKIRVLLTYGGHGFEEKPFYALFEAIPDIQVTKCELPRQADLLKPGLEKDYDVIVMYDMCQKFTPEQQKAFAELVQQGIGVFSLHHNVGAHFAWDEFRKIIGGRFCLKDCEIDGKEYKQTPWSHDEDLKITVADKEHPITRGIGDFEIHDETYGPFYTAEGIHVLLKTDHPKNNPLVAWTTSYGKSPVFYLMLGHDGKAYENPSFRKLVAQGIRWAAAESKK